MTDQQPEEEELFANYLRKQVLGRASGAQEDCCKFEKPREKYFIGSFRSAEEEDTDPLDPTNVGGKISPMAFGLEFAMKLPTSPLEIQIEFEWANYYRVFPQYQEQKEFLNKHENAEEGDEENPAREVSKDLCPKYKKIKANVSGSLSINNSNQEESQNIETESLQDDINEEFQNVFNNISKDPMRFRVETDQEVDKEPTIPFQALTSQSTYQSFLESLTKEVPLDWDWKVKVNVDEKDNESSLFRIYFINESCMPYYSDTRDNSLFNPIVTLNFPEKVIKPFELELAPEGFRYDNKMWGKGYNCSVDSLDKRKTQFKSNHVASYSEPKYIPETQPKARFDELSEKPIPTLEKVLASMQDFRTEWEDMEQNYKNEYGQEWEAEFKQKYEKDYDIFLNEIERFKKGLDLIQQDENVKLAFKLMNETFSLGDHSSWRMFQLVFILSQIPGIASLEQPTDYRRSEREKVDIIYFPTGGGKTEAYLGVIVFHCFYDRLRGKKAGVTSWLRFPLRLLTLQQTQRMAEIIGLAEIVRLYGQASDDPRLTGTGVNKFSVGYYVGSGGSPNQILNPEKYKYAKPKDKITWSKATDSEKRKDWQRVFDCPYCAQNGQKGTVELEFDKEKSKLIHRCSREECKFPDGELPVHIVDNEIYRYLPSIIVGTIDKLASIGLQRKFSHILGKVDGYCELHGFYSGKKCSQKDCHDKNKLHEQVPEGLSGPTLFIQDELHLLREGLGTFDSHYETFTQEILKKFNENSQPLKLIASTATIEKFDHQVEHLYGRAPSDARRFPGPGPKLGESFYAHTLEQPQRFFFGFIPHNKTTFRSHLELIQYYQSELQKLSCLKEEKNNPYGGNIQPGGSDWDELIDKYLTSLSYFLKTQHLTDTQSDLDTSINKQLRKKDFHQLRVEELSGSTPMYKVSDILGSVKTKKSSTEEAINSILATSMISHGVDVSRFNTMLFFGMPRENAEYIQASSRVGRTHVGLIFTCLDPLRERDRSHYLYFNKYHQYLGQLVEPVAINRWSRFSIERTIPGLFLAVILQIIANEQDEQSPNSYYFADQIKQKLNSNEIQYKDFINILRKAYKVEDPQTPIEKEFHEDIKKRVEIFCDQIRESSFADNMVSEVLHPRPMMSLRQIDEPIPIEINK